MQFVYILEDEQRFIQELSDCIRSIDPKLQIRVFATLEEFVQWMKILLEKGKPALIEGGKVPLGIEQETPSATEDHELRLVVAKVEALGSRHLGLVDKTRQVFTKLGLCPVENLTSFVFTAFDNPTFKIANYQKKFVSNLIFKPFDKPIMTQHLMFAIDGNKPPSKLLITSQKTNARVEMVKDIEKITLTETGFTTISNQKLEPGTVAKYYGSSFTTDRTKSVMAKLESCQVDTTDAQKSHCFFGFFAVENAQLSNMRRLVSAKDAKALTPLVVAAAKKGSGEPLEFVAIMDDQTMANTLKDSLSQRLGGFNLHHYSNMLEFLTDLDPKSANSSEGSQPNVKAFTNFPELEFVFDKHGSAILSFETGGKDPGQIFGLPSSEIINKQNWFTNALGPESRESFKKWIHKPETGQAFKIKVKDTLFYIQPSAFTSHDKTINIKFKELSSQEKNDFLIKNSKLPKNVDVLLVSYNFLFGGEERWLKIQEMLSLRSSSGKKTAIFGFSNKTLEEDEERRLATFVEDIFYEPIDRLYVMQKLASRFPNLFAKGDPVQIRRIVKPEVIKVANPIQIEEISEAALVLVYPRKLEVGEYREFILWHPFEHQAPIHKAVCNYSIESESKKGEFKTHFIFFGVTDNFLKSVRIWIRDSYILSKDKS